MAKPDITPSIIISGDHKDIKGAKTLLTLAEGAVSDLPTDVAGVLNSTQDRIARVAASMTVASHHRISKEEKAKDENQKGVT